VERSWWFEEPIHSKNGELVGVTKTTITDTGILDAYWEFWTEKLKSLGREHLISKENCIQDYVVTHWAQEVK
jgi:hypothetical protein